MRQIVEDSVIGKLVLDIVSTIFVIGAIVGFGIKFLLVIFDV